MCLFIGGNDTQSAYNNTLNELDEDIRCKMSYKKICDIMGIFAFMWTMLVMGPKIEFKQVLNQLKHPLDLTIGLICQLILVPLIGFSLSQALNAKGPLILGFILVSCCPEGSLGVIFTYFINGDVGLSVTMMLLSTLLALGFMPFNLWVYGHWIDTSNLVIPYKQMAASLALGIFPAVIGGLLKQKYPKCMDYFTKVGSNLGMIFVITVVILYNILAFPGLMKNIPWRLIVAAIVQPCICFILGYVIAIVCKRNTAICKAIAGGCSVLGVSAGITVLALSPFSYKEQSEIIKYPLFYCISMPAVIYAVSIPYQIWKKCFLIDVKKETDKLPPAEKATKNAKPTKDDAPEKEMTVFLTTNHESQITIKSV